MVDRFVLLFAEVASLADLLWFVLIEVIINCGVSCVDLGGNPEVQAIKPGDWLSP